MSSVATSLARVMGLRAGTTTTAVPSLRVVVAAEARARAMSGSTMSPQSLGTGFSTATGSVCCSGTQIESNPSSSARLARIAISVERTVGMVEIPNVTMAPIVQDMGRKVPRP